MSALVYWCASPLAAMSILRGTHALLSSAHPLIRKQCTGLVECQWRGGEAVWRVV